MFHFHFLRLVIYSFLWLYYTVCRILVPWLRMEHFLPALRVWRPNHFTTRKVPLPDFFLNLICIYEVPSATFMLTRFFCCRVFNIWLITISPFNPHCFIEIRNQLLTTITLKSYPYLLTMSDLISMRTSLISDLKNATIVNYSDIPYP